MLTGGREPPRLPVVGRSGRAPAGSAPGARIPPSLPLVPQAGHLLRLGVLQELVEEAEYGHEHEDGQTDQDVCHRSERRAGGEATSNGRMVPPSGPSASPQRERDYSTPARAGRATLRPCRPEPSRPVSASRTC